MIADRFDNERLAAFAARVLADLYAVVYQERPAAMRAWCEHDELVIAMRLVGPMPLSDGPRGRLPHAGLPDLVAAAVAAQTAWELTVVGWSAEADLGLVRFVFGLPGALRAGENTMPATVAPIAGAAGLNSVAGGARHVGARRRAPGPPARHPVRSGASHGQPWLRLVAGAAEPEPASA
jgi:hypothetical protein